MVSKQAKKRRLALEDLQTNEQLPPLDSTEKEWEVNDRFNIISDIGGGAYGIVYKAKDRDRDGKIVALKKIFVKEDAETGVPHHIMREVANLRLLESSNDQFEHPIVRYVPRRGRCITMFDLSCSCEKHAAVYSLRAWQKKDLAVKGYLRLQNCQ